MEPDITIQNRVVLTMTNIDENNVQAKSKELIQILTSESIPWFLNYLVNKHVISDKNHLDVFANMLTHLSEGFSEIQDLAVPVVVNGIKVRLELLSFGKQVLVLICTLGGLVVK